MIARLQKSMKEKDQGFTLIELLVVIVIIGILAAIAIPLFLSQREKGVDAGVQSDLKALATVEETVFTDGLAYTTAVADLEAAGFKPTAGSNLAVAVTSDGFCLRGFNPDGSKDAAGNAYMYDSLDGGLGGSTGACSGTPTFTTVAP